MAQASRNSEARADHRHALQDAQRAGSRGQPVLHVQRVADQGRAPAESRAGCSVRRCCHQGRRDSSNGFKRGFSVRRRSATGQARSPVGRRARPRSASRRPRSTGGGCPCRAPCRHVLADVLGVVADALERARHPQHVERAADRARVFHHERDALALDGLVLLVDTRSRRATSSAASVSSRANASSAPVHHVGHELADVLDLAIAVGRPVERSTAARRDGRASRSRRRCARGR